MKYSSLAKRGPRVEGNLPTAFCAPRQELQIPSNLKLLHWLLVTNQSLQVKIHVNYDYEHSGVAQMVSRRALRLDGREIKLYSWQG
jgi:hypothetical protein